MSQEVHETLPDEATSPDVADIPIRPEAFLWRTAGVSGLYVRRQGQVHLPQAIPTLSSGFPVPDDGLLPGDSVPEGVEADELGDAAVPAIRISIGGELRLDVDGRYPQMVASGTLHSGLFGRASWIASVARTGRGTWSGPIFYRDGSTPLLPYTDVTITTTRRTILSPPASATARFTSGAGRGLTLTYGYRSASFHDVEMEYDCATGVTAVTRYDTGSHPNRPATSPVETLSIEEVYRRAGLRVIRTSGDDIVPLSGAGADAQWSDAEMHDAMQTYWSRFANTAQWSVWTFFAAQSDQGPGLGGIMFDDIGAQNRQGTAIFEDSFIATPPAGDPNGAAFVERMRFWTALHELGHTFNLAHAWQKSLVSGGRGPWITLLDEPEARSPMNYPYRVTGGASAFFADFAYRFTDDELLFLRHAPERFVEQGNAAWFDQHGFEQATISPEPKLNLELRVHRDDWAGIPTFGFLEPVYVELKLANISHEPVIVDEHILLDRSSMVVVAKREGRDAQMRLPYATFCNQPAPRVLMPGEALYESLLASVTKGGFTIDEPGRYAIQVALQLPSGGQLVSNLLRLQVAPPKQRAHELLASDYFTDDVARIYAFGGSRVLTSGNHALEEVAAQLADEPVASHAHLVLGRPLGAAFKRLDPHGGGGQRPMSIQQIGGEIIVDKADVKMAEEHLHTALDDAPAAAETLGHIRYKRAVDRFATLLADQGEQRIAVDVIDQARRTLADRGVIQPVLDELTQREETLAIEARSQAKGAKQSRSAGAGKRRSTNKRS